MTGYIQQYVLGFLVALVSSWMLTRFVGDHARRIGLVDPVDDRKIHTEPIPRLGGVALFASIVLTLAILAAAAHQLGSPYPLTKALFALVAGGGAMFALGLYDDLHPMRARYKLAAQVGIALAVNLFGLGFTNLTFPFFGSYELAPAVATLLTVGWLVGITNAFNLIDGLDGLAGGVALFALATFFVVAVLFQHTGVALTAVVLAGATLGFLRFNFHPATIFLGDSGSLCAGFLLAGIGLTSAEKAPGSVAIIIPVVALGLPILDTALTIFRRFLRLQPIFSPDRGHIHHRLLGRGHSPRNVALLLYVACGLFAIAGSFMAYPADSVVLLVVLLSLISCLALGFLVQRLGFIEFQELGRLARGAVHPRETIGRNVRFREASSRLAELDDVREIFTALGQVFGDERVPRAEVRLQRWFLNRRPSVVTNDGRGDDELPVWTWNSNGAGEESWWEIVLPLVALDERRLGSLVIWEEGQSYAASLSHLHVISGHLRMELQQKLQMLAWPAAEALAQEVGLVDMPALEKVVGMDDPDEAALRASRELMAAEAERGSLRDFLRIKRK